MTGSRRIFSLPVFLLQWVYLLVAAGLFLAAEHPALSEPETREEVS